MSDTRLYRPSNGTEGEIFRDAFCDRCKKDRNERRPCRILSAALLYHIGEKGYPKQWVRDADASVHGNPRCTAFVEAGSSIKREPPDVIRDVRQIDLPL